MKTLDFDELVAQVADSTQYDSSQSLTIVGGTCPAGNVLTFLSAWGLPKGTMPYCLWEEVSRIVLEEKTLPPEPALLERGRVFGPGGDLSLRRDGDAFRWWFIGPAGVTAPTAYGQVHDFWADKRHQGVILHRHEETALLWGVWEAGHAAWHEDRVAGARLHYPGLSGQPERVQVRYRSFTTAGQVMFVWFRELEAYHG